MPFGRIARGRQHVRCEGPHSRDEAALRLAQSKFHRPNPTKTGYTNTTAAVRVVGYTSPGFTVLRLYSLQPFFTKAWRPREIEQAR